MKLQSTFMIALGIATLTNATRLYVSSYSGNVTTLDLTPKLGGSLNLNPAAVNTGCGTSPSWLEFDSRTNILYCSDEDNLEPTKASFSSFQTSTNGTLARLSNITTLGGCVHSMIYENDTVLAIANYAGSGITVVDISQPASLNILQQTSFVFSDKEAHPPLIHQVFLDPTKKFLLAPDLSADSVHVFAVNAEGMLERMPTQQDISVHKGHGPRHGLFYKTSATSNTTYLYMLFETANIVHGYTVTYNPDRTLNFTIFQDFQLPVPTGAAAAGEIKLTPDNKYLIVSSRNDTGSLMPNINSTGSGNMTSDTLFTFKINPNNGSFTLAQDSPAYGLGPRQFSINANGTLVAVALATSNRVAVIGRNAATGMMTQMIGYFDLEVGGQPGLITSVVFDEVEDAGRDPSQGDNYTGTTIVLTATDAGGVSQATAPPSAQKSSVRPQSSVSVPQSISSMHESSSTTAPSFSNPGKKGTFTTSPYSGGSQLTGVGSTSIATPSNNIPTSASGAGVSATGAVGATPSPVQPGIATNCNKFHQVVSGDTCSSIAEAAGVALPDFLTWNPAVGDDCKILMNNYYACIGVGS